MYDLFENILSNEVTVFPLNSVISFRSDEQF